ncbi:MAG: response regulator [Turneriella sp.]|nr:response regulator [Turneriella sp.]
MQILIVDDSELMRSIVEQVIRENLPHASEQLHFFHAANGHDAMAIFETNPIGLVLLDWNMPILDGVGFVKQIRSRGSKVPIVMITSVTDSAKILEAAAAGVNSYVEKPVRGAELWAQLAPFFRNAGF